jgi:hypothetical protein
MSYADSKIIKNSLFLKVEEGKPHVIRLLDESPVEQWQHKIGDKLTPCIGEQCPHCDEGHSRSQRFVTNVYDHTDGRVYLWSYSPTIGEILRDLEVSLNDQEENILEHDLDVTAKGSGMQKKTGVQLRLKSRTLPGSLKKIAIKSDYVKPLDEPAPPEDAPPSEEIPF